MVEPGQRLTVDAWGHLLIAAEPEPMRFSANGYYIERYVKCATCGMLVYGEGIAGTAPRQALHLLLRPGASSGRR